MNWRDLYVIVRNSDNGAVFKAIHGERAEWGLQDHLLARIGDTLDLLWWAKTEDATKNRNRPKPLPRPGITDDSKKQIGSGSLPVDAMREWLGGDFVNLN